MHSPGTLRTRVPGPPQSNARRKMQLRKIPLPWNSRFLPSGKRAAEDLIEHRVDIVQGVHLPVPGKRIRQQSSLLTSRNHLRLAMAYPQTPCLEPDESDAAYTELFNNSIRLIQRYAPSESALHYSQSPTLHPDDISQPFTLSSFHDGRLHNSETLPSFFPHHVRALIMDYCGAIASPSPRLALTQVDLQIVSLIQARMQQLNGLLEGPSYGDAYHEAGPAIHSSVSPPPHTTAIDSVPTTPEPAIKCRYDGCNTHLQSLSLSDIASHLRLCHFNKCSKDAWNRADDNTRVVCQWPHCNQDRPLLRRNLAKHVKDVHLRENRIVCCHPGCTDSFSRRDAMVRHAKKCQRSPSHEHA